MYNNIRLLMPTILVILLASATTAWMDYRKSSALLTSSILENQKLIAGEITRTVSHGIQHLEESASIVAGFPPVVEALRHDDRVRLGTRELIHDVLSRVVHESEFMENITVFTPKGQVVASSATTIEVMPDETTLNTVKNGGSVLESMQSPLTGKFMLHFVKPVMEDGEVIGLVRTAYRLSVLAEMWRAILPEGKGYIARIANAEGLVISCSCPVAHEAYNIHNMPVAQALKEPAGTLVPFVDNGMERLGMYMPIPGTGMRIIIGVDRHAAFRDLNALFRESLLINICMAAAMLGAVLFTLSSLIRTIQRLNEEKRVSLLKDNQKLESLVSERTQALREQHAHLVAQHKTMADILETSPIGISISTPEGSILYANPTAMHLFGDETGVIHPHKVYRDIRQREEVTAHLKQGRRVFNQQMSMISGSGQDCEVLLSAVKVQYEGEGAVLRWFVDVTEMRAVERAFEAERTLLRSVFDAIPDCIHYKSLSGVYLACNRAFAALFDRRPEEVIGKTDAELSVGGEGEQEPAAGNPDVFRQDENLRTAEGGFLEVETLNTPCVDENGKLLGILRISRDISERKRMEQELVRAREEAQAASLAKSTFLANMSHEIRTPMNGIMGLSHLALQMEDMPAQLRSYLNNIDMSARSLLRIINDILDFSKIEAGRLDIEKTPFHLDGVLEGVIQPLMPTITEKGLELLFDLDPNLPEGLVGDPTRLRQVIMNLVSNAVKFTHEGSIVIRVRVQQTGVQSGNSIFLRFSIRDTGIGMDEVYKARVFESFSQADSSITRRYGGTGLGLSISKNLVRLMGGDISVDSKPGKGTTFSFMLPFERCECVPCAVHAADLADMHILVVDDNEISRKILSENLLRFGARIHVTDSGRQAVAEFEASLGSNPYDVVILDWKMPELDGLETARRIYGRMLPGQKVPTVIMVTAHERELVLSEAQSVGISTVLTKPVTPAALREVVLHARTLDPSQYPQTEAEDALNALSLLSSVAEPAAEPCRILGKSLAGKHVLLVEDNEINQLIAVEMLKSYGCDVTVAVNGIEAVSRVSEKDFDAILMDIQMPEMGGIEATMRIRTVLEQNSVPIIAMTANAMAGDHERSLRAGMQAHLTKPINPDELYATLVHWTGKTVQ